MVDVDVDAAELVDEADEAGEGDVDDAVELEPGKHLFDGLGGERGALVVAGQDAADRVGGVDLRGVVDLPRGAVIETSRSRGIESTEVCSCSGSKRTSSIVSLCAAARRSSEFLEP